MSKQVGVPEPIRTAIRRFNLGKISDPDVKLNIDDRRVNVHIRRGNVYIRDYETDEIVNANNVLNSKGVDAVNIDKKTLTDKYRVAQKQYRTQFVYVAQD